MNDCLGKLLLKSVFKIKIAKLEHHPEVSGIKIMAKLFTFSYCLVIPDLYIALEWMFILGLGLTHKWMDVFDFSVCYMI